jgi:hypothetical protein
MRNGDDDVRATAKYVLEISDPESSKCSTICMPQADARVFFALVTKFKMTIEGKMIIISKMLFVHRNQSRIWQG